MIKPDAHLSSDFLFPKLHGRWSTAVAGDQLENLIRANNLQAVVRLLTERGLSTGERVEVQKDLTRSLIAELAGIQRFLSPALAHLYSRLIDGYFLDNLKTLLHYRYFPPQSGQNDIRTLLVDNLELPPLPAELMLEAKSVHQFFKLIPAHELRDRLLIILVELDDTHDLFTAESRIDALYFEWLLTAARELPVTIRHLALAFVRLEIDITNMVTLLRNLTVYKMPEERIFGLMIPGGALLAEDALTPLCSVSERRMFSDQLPREYRKMLAGHEADEIYRSENILWTHLYVMAEQAFKDYNHPARAVVAYPYLRRFEHTNLARLFEAAYLRLEPAIVRSMMIGVNHV
jgi:vacuolar-type H+-ATPase subunit C/Vma6